MPKIKGVTLPHEKKSASMPGKRIPCPETAVYPMQQHIGRPAAVAVKPGDRVYTMCMARELRFRPILALAESGDFRNRNSKKAFAYIAQALFSVT